MSLEPDVLGAAEPHGSAMLAPRPKGAGKARRAPRSQTFARSVVLLLVLGYLVVPLLAMLEFSTRGPIDKVTRTFPRSLEHFAAIFSYPTSSTGSSSRCRSRP